MNLRYSYISKIFVNQLMFVVLTFHYIYNRDLYEWFELINTIDPSLFGCFYLVDMIACTTTTPMNMNSAQIRPSLKEGSGLCWYSPSCCLLKCIKIGLKSSLGFFIDLKELQEKCKLLLHELNRFAKYEYTAHSDAYKPNLCSGIRPQIM